MTASAMNDSIRASLRAAYDRYAAERDQAQRQAWKLAERQRFLDLLQAAGARSLLEVGAGPGHDSLFFQQQGLDVTAVDLSPAMVALCHEKGVTARVMDMTRLDFPAGSFDAVFAFNALLHLPKVDLPETLAGMATILSPQGLFYLGQYGGRDEEGEWADDAYVPKRYFSYYTDEDLLAAVTPPFELVTFHGIAVPEERSGLHFQAMVLRKQPAE